MALGRLLSRDISHSTDSLVSSSDVRGCGIRKRGNRGHEGLAVLSKTRAGTTFATCAFEEAITNGVTYPLNKAKIKKAVTVMSQWKRLSCLSGPKGCVSSLADRRKLMPGVMVPMATRDILKRRTLGRNAPRNEWRRYTLGSKSATPGHPQLG